MKKSFVIVLLGFLFLFPSLVQFQPFGPKLHPEDLKAIQLGINPDPLQEGQWMSF